MTLGLNEESRDRGKEYAGRLHLLEKNEDRRQMGEIGFLGVSTSLLIVAVALVGWLAHLVAERYSW
jgi:hypothetical protein